MSQSKTTLLLISFPLLFHLLFQSPLKAQSNLASHAPNKLLATTNRLANEAVSVLQKENQNSIDPATGVVHSGRLQGGLPLGGIGAGSFQYMTDGTFSRAMLSGNYDLPSGDLPGCFAAVRTRSGDKVQAKVLALKSEYGLPVVTKLDFD